MKFASCTFSLCWSKDWKSLEHPTFTVFTQPVLGLDDLSFFLALSFQQIAAPHPVLASQGGFWKDCRTAPRPRGTCLWAELFCRHVASISRLPPLLQHCEYITCP